MWLRWLELLVLFVVLPVLIALFIAQHQALLMPLLFALGLFCLWQLLKDRNFKRFRLLHTRDLRLHLRNALILFIPVALIFSLLFYILQPDMFFQLPREQWPLWLTTLLIYPLVSVIPQELIFRTYFFHRYKTIIPSKLRRCLISSASFSCAHAVYGNWVAVGLSAVAGLLFGYRYMRSRSTLVVVIEHTLWGSFAFTVGVGSFFLTR